MRIYTVLLIAFIVSACSTSTATPVRPEFVVTIVPPTPVPSKTPQPTATLTTAQAMQPYTIAGLREREYESGTIKRGEPVLETEHFIRYLISYPSDGLTITGVLQIPKVGEAPYPVIVMNHGFFSRYIYNSGDGTDRASDFLNRRGYLTISSDYRLSLIHIFAND